MLDKSSIFSYFLVVNGEHQQKDIKMLTIKEYEVINSDGENFININKNFHYIFGSVKEKGMNVLEFDNYDEAISFKENNEPLGKPFSICSGISRTFFLFSFLTAFSVHCLKSINSISCSRLRSCLP